MAEARLAFDVEWIDTTGVVWKYLLRHYPATREIELVDSKQRLFLRRTVLPDIATEQLVLGAAVTVYARQLRVVGYADASTAAAYQQRIESTLALIKPDGLTCMGDILSAISAAGFQISRLRMCQLSQYEAEQFYGVHRQQPFFPALTRFMSSGPILTLELVGEGAVSAWRQALGPTDSNLARQQAPGSIRAQFGTDKTYNAVHGSDSPTNAVAELAFFFGSQGASMSSGSSGPLSSATPQMPACTGCVLPGRVHPLVEGRTLCVIKPHAVREGHTGAIISAIQEQGLHISASESFTLDRHQATQFHEVYRGVVSPAEFEGMVSELSSGACVALEVACPEGSGMPAVELLRTLCGPSDPELARAVRPASLRAQFGSSSARNAVHCTDLQDDAQLEVGFFFMR